MSESSNKQTDLYDNDPNNVHLHNSSKSGKCEVPNELFNYRDIMLKNQFDLKKKEEEVQEYAKKLTKIKSKVKSLRHNTESGSKLDDGDDSILGISDPKTPSEKGLLLKKKLEENRKIFELKNKELNESKRAAELKVEQLIQQLNDNSTASTNSQLILRIDDKDKKINELNNQIIELESVIIDLKDNLSNKDAVIESKTKAITLVTDTLSQRSKVSLDTLEDTKDEMRHMQENFIRIEIEMKSKIDSLLSEIQNKDSSISTSEDRLRNIGAENEQLKLQFDNFNLLISDKDKKIVELEEKFRTDDDINDLINEKDKQIAKLQHDIHELNHNMIKVKAQNKSKLKNLQRRLDSYCKASSSNEGVVNFVNQIAVLEEEIGNLQLNLVDFDETRVVNEDLKKQIAQLKDQLSLKMEEVDSFYNAVVSLENKKLELMYELHEVKQEVVALESKNAECENQRVTAELKIVELEEKLEFSHKHVDNKETINVTLENAELARISSRLQSQMIENFDPQCDEDVKNLYQIINNVTNSFDLLYNRLNSDYMMIEDLVKSCDSDDKYIDNSKHIITQLGKQLKELSEKEKDETDKSSSIEEINLQIDIPYAANISKLTDSSESTTEKSNNSLIDELTSQLDSLQINVGGKRKFLLSILNKMKMIGNKGLRSGEKSTIINELDEQLKVIDRKLKDKNQLIDSILKEKGSIVNDANECDNSNLKNSLKIDKLSKEVLNLRQNITEYERKMTLITSAKDILENQVEVCVEKGKLNEDLHNQIENLTSEIEQKKAMIETMWKENPLLEDQVREQELINADNLLKIDELTHEVSVAKQQLENLEKNLVLILSDKQMLEDQMKISDDKLKSIDELYVEIKELNNEVEAKAKIIESMLNEKTDLQNQLKEKTQLHAENILKINELSDEMIHLKAKITEHESNLALHLTNKDELKEEIRMRDEKLKSADELYNQLSRKIDDQDTVIQSLSDEKVTLQSQLSEKEASIEDNALKINELANEMAILKQKIAEHELNFTLILSDKNILEGEMKVRDEKLQLLTDLHNENEQLKNETRSKERIIESISKEKASLENHLKEKEDLIEENALRINDMSNEITMLRQKIAEHNENFASIFNDKEMLEKRVKMKDEELKFITEMQNQIEQEKIILENQLHEKDELYQDGINKINDLSQEIETLNQQIAGYEQNFTFVSDEKQMLEDQINLRDDKLISLNKSNDLIEKLTIEIVEKQGMIESILNENTELKDQLIEKQQLHHASIARIDEFTDEIVNLKETIANHEKNLTIILSDKEIFANQMKAKEEHLQSMNEIYNENELLRNDIDSKAQVLELIAKEKAALEDQLRETELKNENSILKIQELSNELSVLEQKLSEYEQNFTFILNDKKMLEDDIKAKDEKLKLIDNLNVQIDQLSKDIASREKKIAIILNEKNAIENQLHEREHLNTDSVFQMNHLSNEIMSLNRKLMEYDGNFTTILNDKLELEEQMKLKDEQLAAMNELNNRIEQLNNAIVEKETKVQLILSEKATLENQLHQKEELNQDNVRRISELTNDIAELQSKITEYERSETVALSNKEMLEDQIRIKDEKLNLIDELRAQIEELNNEIENKQSAIDSIFKDKEALENQLEEKELLNRDSLSRTNKLLHEMEILQQKAEDREQDFTSILNDKTMLEEQIKEKDLQLKLIGQLQVQIDQLAMEIEGKGNTIESIMEEKTMLENQLSEKEQLHKNSLIQINDLSSEINELKNQIVEHEQNFASILNDKEMLENELITKNEKVKMIEMLNEQITQLGNEMNSKDSLLDSITIQQAVLESKSKENEYLYQDRIAKVNELMNEIGLLTQKIREYEDNIPLIIKEKELLEDEIKIKDKKLEFINELQVQIDQLSEEIRNKESMIDTVVGEKNTLADQLKAQKQLNYSNAIKIEELKNEIDNVKIEVSKREQNISSLLDGMMILEEELRRAKEESADNHEKLGIMENLKIQLENQIEHANKVKLEITLSHKVIEESRIKCMDSLYNMNTELENVAKDAALKQDDESQDNDGNVVVSDNARVNIAEGRDTILRLKSELENAKKQNLNQIQKMKIIAANLKKKTAQCQEFEMAVADFKEKWENEVSEKKELSSKLDIFEVELNDKNRRIAEFDELSMKKGNELQYLKVKIETLESDINDRVIQFNNIRDKLVVELDNCRREHLMDGNLKETYQKVLDLGVQLKDMELKNLSDLNSIQTLKSQSNDIASNQLNEFQDADFDYSNRKDIFEFVTTKIMEDGGINRKDFKHVISKMAEKYIIIETLKLKNRKLIEIINSFYSEQQARNEKLQSSQLTEMQDTVINEEIVNTAAELVREEKVDKMEDTKESEPATLDKADQSVVNLEEDDVWGWNEQNVETSEFKMTSMCTPETQMEVNIAELEDKVKDLQDKKVIVDEELKVIQLKNKKLIKKLQEYKIQNYNLQQQLKLQTNSSKLSDLDFTIEEELKSQIAQLERNLSQVKNENEKISTERDSLMKKIEILTATKDELNKTMAMKHNELMMQIQTMSRNILSSDSIDKGALNKNTEFEWDDAEQKECLKCNEEIPKLEESLNVLSMDNSELKALVVTYEEELNAKVKEIEHLKSEIGYSKLNFYNMLEESHNEKKECLGNLGDAFAKTESISTSHQMALEKEKLENDELKASVATLREVEEQMNVKLNNLAEELKLKNNEIDEMRATLENIESLMNEEVLKKKQLEQECEDMKKKLIAKNEEFETILVTNEQQRTERNLEVQSLTNQLQGLSEELKLKNEGIIEITSNFENLRHNFNDEQQKNNLLQLRYEEILNELQVKTEEFNTKFKEKESKILSLDEHLKQTLESLSNKTEELKNMEISLEDKLKACQDANNKLISEQVSELQVSLSEEQVDLSAEENLEKSTKEQENYTKSYEDLQRKLSEVNEAMTNVTELLNIRVQEVADLKQYIKTLEFDKLAVDNVNSELSNVNTKLSDKNQDITLHLNKLKEELNEKTEIVIFLEAKVLELQSLNDSAINDLNNQQLEVKSLKEIINNNEVLISNLNTSISDRDVQISNLKAELFNENNQVQELSTMIADVKGSIIPPEELTEKVQKIERLEKVIKTTKEEHSALIDEYERKLSENAVAIEELKTNLSLKNEEVEDLKFILNDNTYPAIIQELQNKIDNLYGERHQLKPSMEENVDELSSQIIRNKNISAHDDNNQTKDPNTSELDLALYMLHQRDVRCEELTHELLQLLEERDTLQLRLSNAIKMNEELKRHVPSTSKILSEDLEGGSSGETADSSPAIAKPIESNEDMDILNQKLSQLHNVNYHRDIRLIDERESRHLQQMSVIPYKNTLSPLSTDAAAKLIDAKYTVSRDVQSQSNVLLNWFWGKSTPKVTHM